MSFEFNPAQKKPRSRLIGAAALSVLLVCGSAAPSFASTEGNNPSEQSTKHNSVELMVQDQNGDWQPVEKVEPLDFASTATDPTARLIDFGQWAQCFTFNQADTTFGQYGWINGPGTAAMVRLTCGNPNVGYKHIKQQHEGEWQVVLANAEATGWDKSTYLIDTWDDLMYMALINAIGGPGGTENNYSSNKACASAVFGLIDANTHKVKYSFRNEAVISMNNLITITSFPSRRDYCNNY